MLSMCLFSRVVGDMHDILVFSTKEETALAERMEVQISTQPACTQDRMRVAHIKKASIIQIEKRRVIRVGDRHIGQVPIRVHMQSAQAKSRTYPKAICSQGVVSFLRINRVPVLLQQRIRAWAGFRLTRDRADAQLQEVPNRQPISPFAHA